MDFLLDSTESRDKMIAYLHRLPLDKRRYRAKILAVRRSRSLDQNAYQWFVFEMIAQEFGSDKLTIHAFFSDKFLRVQETISGHTFERIRGTSELSTIDHSKFMEDVRMWCAIEEGIIVPLPGEIITEKLNLETR
jgi:hypothetical protein